MTEIKADKKEDKKETPEAAPKASTPGSTVVKVKNIGKGNISTSKGIIEPGKTGLCTMAELRGYGKYLKKASGKPEEE